MKFLLPLFLIFQTNAVELGIFTECSDPAANVIYEQLTDGNTLLVTQINEMNGLQEKIELKNFKIDQISAQVLENRTAFTCNESAVKIDEVLSFRKVVISNLDQSLFAGNIIGVSGDRGHILVDYLCKTTILSDCQ